MNDRSGCWPGIMLIVATAVVIWMLMHLHTRARDCASEGGQLVRGAFSLVCIK